MDGRPCRLPDRLLCLPESHLSPPSAPQSPVCTEVQHPAGRQGAWAGNLGRSALVAALLARQAPHRRPNSPGRHTAAAARVVQSAATSRTAALPAALTAQIKPRRGLKGARGCHAHPSRAFVIGDGLSNAEMPLPRCSIAPAVCQIPLLIGFCTSLSRQERSQRGRSRGACFACRSASTGSSSDGPTATTQAPWRSS